MKKISIELYRFVFMLVIVFWHFRGTLYCQQGYLAVEFFFILSGYLLYKSFLKASDQTPWRYTIKRIRRFFPEYFTALVISTALDIFSKCRNGYEMDYLKTGIRFITEVLFVQNIGFFYGGANYPCWYLSILIIGGFLLWALLRISDSTLTTCILLIIACSTYAFFGYDGGTFEHWDHVFPLMRGIAGMSLGIVVAKAAPRLDKLLPTNGIFKMVAELILFGFCMYAIISGKIHVIFMPFVFCLLIYFAFSSSWSESLNVHLGKCLTVLGGCTFGMLVYHASISYCCSSAEKLLGTPVWVTNIAYLAILIIVSILSKKLLGNIGAQRHETRISNHRS